MPSFGRIGKLSNRSQHNLAAEPPHLSVLTTGGAGVGGPASGVSSTPPSASSAALSARDDSVQVDTRAAQQQALQSRQNLHAQQQQQQQQLQEQSQQPFDTQQNQAQIFGSDIAGNAPNYPSTAVSPGYSLRQQQQHKANQPDFAELVSRSQSTRYPHQVAPIQAQQQYIPASSSADDLPDTIHSPLAPKAPKAPAPIETKRSARKLIKNILSGSGSRNSDASHQQNTYDNTAGLARRPSKRVSNPYPPNLRTGGSQVSQLSLEQQQQFDWEQQQAGALGQENLPTSIHDVRQADDAPISPKSNQGLSTQQPQDYQGPPVPHPHHTIRQVPTDIDTSPYSQEDLSYQHQQLQDQLQGQGQAGQQHLYGQVVVDPAQDHYQSVHAQSGGQYQPEDPGQLYVGHPGGTLQQQNPETVSQLSHESPTADSDQHSAVLQPHTPPAVHYYQQDFPQENQQFVPSPPSAQSGNMPVPPGQLGNTRSGGQNDKNLRGANNVEPPPGPPPSYRQSQTHALSPLPPVPAAPTNNQNYRTPDRQASTEGAGPEGGRETPQPQLTGEKEPVTEKQFADLLAKYKNVKRLYFDGKKDLDQLTHQVEQLQNAVANQRISQSRTALDDNEYTTKFNRLNGAINNLAFNIRKDWHTLPSWIDRYVSVDALKTGKQEMTAVGRAVVIRWIVDEIFNKCFHPGLDIELSQRLKEIEQSIRKNSYTLNSQEEFDALTAKIVNWRMVTLEGLQRILTSPESADHRSDFTDLATTNLTAHLYQHLTDPAPAGVDGSVGMIVELAVGIAANLPLESRDVAIMYPLPGDTIRTELMEPEKAPLPALPDPDDIEDKDGEKSKRDKSKNGPPPKDPTKVRFAGFVAVEVRGRQVLVKAPVWSLA